MAAVEFAVYNLLNVFHKYSGKEGDSMKLNKSELQVFLVQELPGCFRVSVTVRENCQEVEQAFDAVFFMHYFGDDAMALLDLDGDGEVDFMEFIEFITEITTELQEMYLQNLIKFNRPPKFGARTLSEKAIVTLIKVFYKYAGKGGNRLCLETRELRQLLRKEMPTLHPCLEANTQIRETLWTLDRSGEVDFKAFMSLVANFAVAVEFSFVNDTNDDDLD